MLPDATQVADPYHVVALANRAVDETRRRVQNETTVHRGRKPDPLYPIRRRVITGGDASLKPVTNGCWSCSATATHTSRCSPAWAANELVRRIYTQPDATAARAWVERTTGDFAQRWRPLEVRGLRTDTASVDRPD